MWERKDGYKAGQKKEEKTEQGTRDRIKAEAENELHVVHKISSCNRLGKIRLSGTGVFRRLASSFLLLLMLLLPAFGVTAAEMKVHFLDVGQGLSILVQTEGKNLLYDGGGRNAASFVVSYLEDQGVENLDYLISSHYDEDHLSGLVGCLNRFSVGTVIGSDYVHESKLYSSFMDAVSAKGLEVQYPAVGTMYVLGDAEFEVLAPQTVSSTDSNNNSVVIRLINDGDSFLFAGDAEYASEKEMCASGMDLNCDVLVLGHHGSATSTSWDFLAQTVPSYAVISCGANNSYGHPNAETMEKMESMDIEIFRTDLQGTIVATSSGSGITWNTQPCQDYSSGDGEYSSYDEEEQKYSAQPEDSDAQSGDQDIQSGDDGTQAAEPSASGDLVWLSENGTKYHSKNDCGKMNPDKAWQVSRADAVAMGYEACKKCF